MTDSMEPKNPPMTEESEIKQGQLWDRLLHATAHGHASNALVPIPTTYTILKDSGVRFALRLLESLQQKAATQAIKVASKESPRPAFNPFLPYEKDLFVGDINTTHAVVLNKFKVIDHHMLLITRDFQSQTDLLTTADFHAMMLSLDEIDGLAFFNGGEAAGSSQPHKHLQVIPLPMTPHPKEPRLPIDPLLQEYASSKNIETHPSLPYVHAFQSQKETWKHPPETRALLWQQSYHQLLRSTGLWSRKEVPSGPQMAPYNLLATRHWMMIVPRSQEFYQGISINALGFAGGLLARTPEEQTQIQDIGPFEFLRHVGIPLPT